MILGDQNMARERKGIDSWANKRSAYQVEISRLRHDLDSDVRERMGEEYEARVEALKLSIIAKGVKKALTGYTGKDPKTGEEVIFLTDGMTRFDAVNRAIAEGHQILRVPVDLEHRTANPTDHLLTQFISQMGTKLTPLEEGKLFSRLLNFGMTMKEIVQEIAIYSEDQINDRLALANALPELRTMVADGVIAPSVAVEELKSAQREGQSQTAVVETLKTAVKEAKSSGRKKATSGDVSRVKAAKIPPDQQHSRREAYRQQLLQVAENVGLIPLDVLSRNVGQLTTALKKAQGKK